MSPIPLSCTQRGEQRGTALSGDKDTLKLPRGGGLPLDELNPYIAINDYTAIHDGRKGELRPD